MTKSSQKYLPHLYFIILVLEVAAEFLQWPVLIALTKPLLMPCLIALVISIGLVKVRFRNWLLTSLFFAWFGDVFLLLFDFYFPQYQILFIYGLGSFLIAHIIYIVLFVSFRTKEAKAVLWKQPLLVLPWLLLAFALLSALYKEANPSFIEMQVPVLIYVATILVMLFAAINRYQRVADTSFKLVLFGAIFFLFSDSCIALNKFSGFFGPYKFLAKPLIMSLYGVAQFLLIVGMLSMQNESQAKVS